jgi:hypothetical protein
MHSVHGLLLGKTIHFCIKSLESYTEAPILFINSDLAIGFEFLIQSNLAILQSNL